MSDDSDICRRDVETDAWLDSRWPIPVPGDRMRIASEKTLGTYVNTDSEEKPMTDIGWSINLTPETATHESGPLTWTTTTTHITPEMIDKLTGDALKSPALTAEVDLAVICFKIRYFETSSKLYTYAATGIKVGKKGKRRLWYVTGDDAPQNVTYEELVDWFTSNGREIVEAWVATSWKKLIDESEDE